MVKLDFDKVLIVFNMGWQLWTNSDKYLIFSKRLILNHMYQQLDHDEKESVKNEYPEFVAYLIATN
ncbi:hypothetical protein ACQKN7_07775 [Bacillus cereus]|jgi:uncharacterized membrane protein SpoIIM required for sporulation|uniref:hypothetical protein n=1 Tax=Bacillus cereus TaxID=1396 RepID=UPI0020D26E89|nr:hypothetical protein [Bacillus cereus]MDR2994043.1 hypothetical protein [Bacillus cereus]